MAGSRRVARLQAQRQASSSADAAIATKAVGYIRVSTDEQAQSGHGLEAQERAIRAFAESQGFELDRVFADPGISGSVRPGERPGYLQMLERIGGGAVALVLVWKFDRLARHIVFAVNAVSDLAHHRVAIRSVTEPIDTATPMGRTIFAVLAGMAEQERQAITERTWSGRRAKASKGGFAGGGTPYGYKRDLEGGLVVDPHAAVVVRKIHELAGAGASRAAIARTLNHLGHAPPRGTTWRHGTVGYILDNPKYRGNVEYLFRWSGAEQLVLERGSHEAIVDDDALRDPPAS